MLCRHQSLLPARVDHPEELLRGQVDRVEPRDPPVRHGLWWHSLRERPSNLHGEAELHWEYFQWLPGWWWDDIHNWSEIRTVMILRSSSGPVWWSTLRTESSSSRSDNTPGSVSRATTSTTTTTTSSTSTTVGLGEGMTSMAVCWQCILSTRDTQVTATQTAHMITEIQSIRCIPNLYQCLSTLTLGNTTSIVYLPHTHHFEQFPKRKCQVFQRRHITVFTFLVFPTKTYYIL